MTSSSLSTTDLDNTAMNRQFGYFAELDCCENMDQLRAKINDIVRRLGFSEFSYIQPGHNNAIKPELSTLPEELILSYYNTGLYENDMIFERVRSSKNAFFCSTIHDYVSNAPFASEMTECMRKIRKLYSSFGYYDFYTVPVHNPNNNDLALLMVTQRGINSVELKKRVAGYESTLLLLCDAVNLVTSHKFSNRFSNKKSTHNQQYSVKPRPLRVLSLLANHDFNINDIAAQLGISVVTVNQHLKSARTGLGTKTNYAAIKRAILSGLIQYNHSPDPVDRANG